MEFICAQCYDTREGGDTCKACGETAVARGWSEDMRLAATLKAHVGMPIVVRYGFNHDFHGVLHLEATGVWRIRGERSELYVKTSAITAFEALLQTRVPVKKPPMLTREQERDIERQVDEAREAEAQAPDTPNAKGDITLRFVVNGQSVYVVGKASERLSAFCARALDKAGVVVSVDSQWSLRNRDGTVLDQDDAPDGNVLIAGLGLGMILHPILGKPEVARVTVLERSEHVIKLVGPTVRSSPKLDIIQANVFDWVPPKGSPKWNVIYFDIWAHLDIENLAEMARLHRKFGRYRDKADPDNWMESWARTRLRYMKERMGS